MSKSVVLKHLSNGEIGIARSSLSKWATLSSVDKWEQDIALVKIYLYEANYISALHILETLTRINPQDLSLACDKMLCLYHLGFQKELQSELEHRIHEYNNNGVVSKIGPAIFMAKLLEEMGHFKQAKDLLTKVDYKCITLIQLQSLRIQLLRLHYEIGHVDEVKVLYTQVIKGQEHNQDFEIEREHALMLADSLLYGFEHAFERYKYLQSQNLVPADFHFLRSEIIEQIIIHNKFELLSLVSTKEDPQESYEQQQLKLVQAYLVQNKSFKPSIIMLEKILSPISLLRYLRQYFFLFKNQHDGNGLYARYKFHCQNLQSKYLKEKFNLTLENVNKDQSIELDIQKRHVRVNNLNIKINTSFFWRLIQLFPNDQVDIAFETTICALFQEDLNAQHYDRLRVAISRLNKEFDLKFKIGPLFKFNKDRITLLKKIKALT